MIKLLSRLNYFCFRLMKFYLSIVTNIILYNKKMQSFLELDAYFNYYDNVLFTSIIM